MTDVLETAGHATTRKRKPSRGNGRASFKPGLATDENPTQIQSKLCTDVDAAARFAKEYGQYVRWVPEWGWVYWRDNRVWTLDTGGVITCMAENVGQEYRRLIPNYTHPEVAKMLARWARHCETAKGIRDALTLAQHRCYATVDGFDAEPFLFNTHNRTLDLSRILDGDLPYSHDHSKADYLTKTAPFDWRPGTPCDRWLQFLVELFPSEDMRRFVQRAVGYSILGTTREQCFFVLWGTGCNGKSTFLSTLLHVLGADYALQADPRSFMAGRDEGPRNDLADLRGKRFIAAIETGDGKRLDEALVKAVTGGDALRARHLYREAFTFRPEFTLWLASNHRPSIRETTHAMWRRVRLVPFTQTIPEERRERDLEARLLREGEGILAWAIEGAVQYMRDGLNAPEEVTRATEEYRTAEDTVGQFLGDMAIIEPNGQVSKGALYGAYKAWIEGQGDRAMSQRKFGLSIAEKGYDEYRGNGATRYWIGLGLNSGNDANDTR